MTRASTKRTHVSASQIATYRDCPRKWAYQHVDGLKSPPNKYAQLGLDVHGILARYFEFGTPPDLNTRAGEIAFAGLKHHPAPSPELRVEHEMHFEFEGVEYLGFIDLHFAQQVEGVELVVVDSVAAATEAAAEREVVVVDHKTSTDPDKWAKTEQELFADPQRILYSAWATLVYASIKRVRGRWVYYATRPPYRSRVVELVQTREEIWAAMAGVHVTAQQIVRARERPSSEAERNFAACHAYGGCPFKERCHAGVSAIDRMGSLFEQYERREEERATVPELTPQFRGETPTSTARLLPPSGARQDPAPPAVAPTPTPQSKPLTLLEQGIDVCPPIDLPQQKQEHEQKRAGTMSLLEELEAKEVSGNGVPANTATAAQVDRMAEVKTPSPAPASRRPGRDPARDRARYETQTPVTEPPNGGTEIEQLAATPEHPPEVQEQLEQGEKIDELLVVTDPPAQKTKKAKSDGGTIKLAIADDKTARVLLHAVGILADRPVDVVQAHAKAALGGGE